MRSIQVDLHHRLSTDLSYWVDSAEEHNLIAPDTAMWARFFCPDLARAIEREQRTCTFDEYLDDLDKEGDRVHREYLDWLDGVCVPQEHKLAALGIGIARVPSLIEETAAYVAQTTVQEHSPYLIRNMDQPEGCKLLSRIKQKNATTGGNYDISIFDWKPLKHHKPVKNTIKHITGLHRRYQKYESNFPDEIRVRHIGRPRHLGLADPKERKTIRRGIDLLADLIGYEQVRSFVTGKQPLIIRGEAVSFRLMLGHMGALSHGSMTTEVLVGDERVCNLCIYTPQTPTLDHVVNMITHVRLGLENELIETGNPNRVAIKEPTGIDVLDRRLVRHFERSRVYRAPVPEIMAIEDDDAPMMVETEYDIPYIDASEYVIESRRPEIINLSESKRAKMIINKRSQRVLRNLYAEEFASIQFHTTRIVEV